MGTLILLGLIIRLILLFISNSHPDVGNHLDWGIRFWLYSPQKFYDQSVWSVSWPNQPFASIYLFAGISFLKDLLYNFFLYLNNTLPLFPSKLIWILETNLHVWLVKLPFILSDLGIAVLIGHIVKKYKPQYSLIAAALFLFNPITIYNSTVWGQTDSLINLLAISGLYLTFNKKYFWGTLLFFMSFAFKMSLVIYLPIFAILLFKNLKDIKKILPASLLSLTLLFLITLPFSWGQNPFLWIHKLYTYYVFSHQGNMLNGNAFNVWFISFGADLTRQDNITVLSYLTAKTVGYLLTLPLLFFVWLKLFNTKKITLDYLLYSCLVTAFVSFCLLTNMHERYLYPIFPLMTILLFIRPKAISLATYSILSIIHLINLYNLWFYPDLPFLKQILIDQNFMIGKVLSLWLIFYCGKFLLDYFKSD